MINWIKNLFGHKTPKVKDNGHNGINEIERFEKHLQEIGWKWDGE